VDVIHSTEKQALISDLRAETLSSVKRMDLVSSAGMEAHSSFS